jgi:hypothetical protein
VSHSRLSLVALATKRFCDFCFFAAIKALRARLPGQLSSFYLLDRLEYAGLIRNEQFVSGGRRLNTPHNDIAKGCATGQYGQILLSTFKLLALSKYTLPALIASFSSAATRVNKDGSPSFQTPLLIVPCFPALLLCLATFGLAFAAGRVGRHRDQHAV